MTTQSLHMAKRKQGGWLSGIEPIVVLFTSILVLSGCLQWETSPEPPAFCLHFLFTAETTYESIEIDNSRLVYTFFEDVENKCAHWLYQSPCWTEADLKTRETSLSEGEINDLIDLIRQTSFMKLDNTYGGVSQGQRYYTYNLTVHLAEEKKEVIYQSFPGADPMPEAFKRLIDKLHELVKEKFQ